MMANEKPHCKTPWMFKQILIVSFSGQCKVYFIYPMMPRINQYSVLFALSAIFDYVHKHVQLVYLVAYASYELSSNYQKAYVRWYL